MYYQKIVKWLTGEKSLNAITLLKKDHDKVDELFKKILKTSETSAQRKSIFREIKSELKVHTKLEETLFYPKLKDFSETRELVLNAYREHDLVDKLLAEIDKMNFSSEEWKTKIKILQENVKHHVNEEENELFPKSKKLLSGDELEKIGIEMKELKHKIKKQIH